MEYLKTNRIRLATFAVLALMFLAAIQGMETDDWVITILRGLSMGMLIFLVASGLSLIFGLMDVLNLAHGELFMLGAYAGWTVFVRPDTFVDLAPLLLFLALGLVLLPLWRNWSSRWQGFTGIGRHWPWAALLLGLVLLVAAVSSYPIAIWDPEVYAESPITFSLALSQDNLQLPGQDAAVGTAVLALFGALLASCLLGLAIAGFEQRQQRAIAQHKPVQRPLIRGNGRLVGVGPGLLPGQ